MKRKMSSLLLILLFAFFFSINVKAKVGSCTYGSGGNEITFNIDGAGKISYKSNFAPVVGNVTVEYGNYTYANICGADAIYFSSNSIGGFTSGKYWFEKPTSASTEELKLVSSDIKFSSCSFGSGDKKISFFSNGEDISYKSNLYLSQTSTVDVDFNNLSFDEVCASKKIYSCLSSTVGGMANYKYSFFTLHGQSCSQLDNNDSSSIDSKPIPKPDIDGFLLCDDNGVQQAFQIIGYLLFVAKLLIPLLLIILGTIDFSKAIITSDEKAIKEASTTLIKRVIIGVVIFIIPTILNFAFSLVDGAKDASSGFIKCTDCLFTPTDKSKCLPKKIGE